jgi:hypothetical protein
MPFTKEQKKITRNLKCILTEDETRIYGMDLARSNASKDESEERKKEVDAQLKAEIESHSTRALNLARKINNGYEYRDVECLTEFDFTKNSATITRVDTGEVVEKRAMTDDERQAGLATAKNAHKTHCLNGHPFDADNTHVTAANGRVCKACDREEYWQTREHVLAERKLYYQRNKEKVIARTRAYREKLRVRA